jgi:hypothetical protein
MPHQLHVLNGNATLEPLRQSAVRGDFTVWADVLCEGPLPATRDSEEWRQARAAYLASSGLAAYDGALATARRWDHALDGWPQYDEVVLWLEHDLFDQMLLIRHLDWFGRQQPGRTRLSLICIDRFPGVVPFHGLGQLKPHQLATLLSRRQPVTASQFDLAERAWAAFTGSDPLRLQELVDGGTADLAFLADAIRRYLEEYPASPGGLSRTERAILTSLSGGPAPVVDLFRAVRDLEERVFMGDASFWRVLRGLARGVTPVVEFECAQIAGSPPAGSVAITAAGRRILAGEVDWVALAGVDRWHGGVHLRGRSVPWRWDPGLGRLVTSAH